MPMILRSKHLICTPSATYENGAVAIGDDGRIAAVGPFGSVKRGLTGKIVDLGDEILAPGFVNAHAHLALTALKRSIQNHNSFFDWLYQVVAGVGQWTSDHFIDSVLTGINLSIEGGSTTVVEISNNDEAASMVRLSGIRKYLLFEAIGFDPKRAEECKGLLEDRLASCREEPLLRVGLAPHAPYSVSEDLLTFCRDKASQRDNVLAIHLAETEAEGEYIRTGGGEIRDFKRRLGEPADDWPGADVSPVRYVHDLGLLGHRSLLAHCNYLSDEDIELIAASRATVVYCPRSHRYFGHPTHPLPRLLKAGVPVALGTDSLASNEGLSILDEMKYVRGRFPQIEDAAIYQMATAAAAPTLGAGGQIGVLLPGAFADVLSIRPGDGDSVLERAIGEGSEVTLNMIGGRVLFDSHAGRKEKKTR